MKKNHVRLLIALLLTAFLLYFFLKSVEWNQVWENITRVDLPLFILFTILTQFHLITRALRWNVLLKHDKGRAGFYNRFAANSIGFTVTSLIPARIGELVRPLFLAKKENMKKGFVIGTVVIERAFDVFTMCFLLGLFILARPIFASSLELEKETLSRLYSLGLLGLGVSFLLFGVAISLYFFKETSLRIISFLLKPFPKKITDIVINMTEEFIQGLKFFHSLRDLGTYFLYSLFVWLSIVFMYWILLLAFGVKSSFFLVIPYTFLLAVGAAIPTPGMVGGFHYFSKLGLMSLFGVGANLAVGITIVGHGVQIIATVIVGFIVLWKEGLSLMQVQKMGTQDKD
ncbi:lysylphosphatidylglycerol synthase transmembrane domain-containing protein [Acidobacteriota bacterium]